MKKYVTPSSEILSLYMESAILQNSADKSDKGELEGPSAGSTSRKRGFGDPLWSSSDEEQ